MAAVRTPPRPAGTRTRGTSGRPAPRRRPASSGHRRPVARGRRPAHRGRRPAARAARGWSPPRWWPVLLVVAALVGGVVWNAQQPVPPTSTGTCSVAGTSIELTGAQAANAATIAAVGRARGLPERAIVVALATAQQESRLRNLDHGDRDSLGLFQQRPSQGWGTEAQVQDPVYAANAFYDGLVEVPGWPELRVTDAAQRVQRSGFPEAYQQWQPLGEQLTAALGGAPAALTCSFVPAAVEGRPSARTAAAAAVAEAELGLPATEGFGEVTLDPAAGWAGATWAVAHAERLQLVAVEFAGHRWTPEAGWAPEPDAGDVVRLDTAT